MMIVFKKVYYWSFIIYLSTKWVFKINIGDKIYYKNQVWVVNNKIVDNKLSIIKRSIIKDNINISKVNHININISNCKKVKSFNNLLNSFKSGYRFYMLNWYSIWINNGIEQWCKNCNIW